MVVVVTSMVVVLFVCVGRRIPTSQSNPSSKVISMFCTGVMKVGGEGRGGEVGEERGGEGKWERREKGGEVGEEREGRGSGGGERREVE